jgi:hypothetical protein
VVTVACREDRCDNQPRGFLADTPPSSGCPDDRLLFFPEALHFDGTTANPSPAGGGGGDSSMIGGGASGAGGATAGANPMVVAPEGAAGRQTAVVSVIAESKNGVPRGALHFHLFECTGDAAVPSGAIALRSVDSTCTASADGGTTHFQCRTDANGVARFAVERLQDINVSTSVCAEVSDKAVGTKNRLSVNLVSNVAEVGGLELSPRREVVERAPVSNEQALIAYAELKCVLAPQPAECSADITQPRGSITVSLKGVATDEDAPVVRAPTNLDVSLSIDHESGNGAAWLSLGVACDGARSRSVIVAVPKGEYESPDVQLCSALEGGTHRLVAEAGSARTEATVVFEPPEIAVVFTPEDDGAGGAASTTSYVAKLVAPCGGDLGDYEIVVDGRTLTPTQTVTIMVEGAQSVGARATDSEATCASPLGREGPAE